MRLRSPRARFVRGILATPAAFATVAGRAKAAQFEIRCASGIPIDNPTSIRAKQMWAAVEAESGGRIRAPFFGGAILGGNLALLSQLRVGAIHCLIISAGDLNSLVPAVDITDVGFAFKDVEEGFHAIEGPLGEYMRREVVAKGIHPMRTIWDSGIRQMTTSPRPIRTADDMGGLKIRVVESRITVDFFKTLGATPVPFGGNEVYTALQTKVVDGCDLPLVTIESYRLFEVQKYLSLTNHSWSCLWQLANPDFWRSLPPDLQDVIERNNTKFASVERRDSRALATATGDKLVRQGLTMNRVEPQTFQARLGPYYTRWSAEFGATEWGLLRNAISARLG
jgi:TRAP-type transport system periplasmic protein